MSPDQQEHNAIVKYYDALLRMQSLAHAADKLLAELDGGKHRDYYAKILSGETKEALACVSAALAPKISTA